MGFFVQILEKIETAKTLYNEQYLVYIQVHNPLIAKIKTAEILQSWIL